MNNLYAAQFSTLCKELQISRLDYNESARVVSTVIAKFFFFFFQIDIKVIDCRLFLYISIFGNRFFKNQVSEEVKATVPCQLNIPYGER